VQTVLGLAVGVTSVASVRSAQRDLAYVPSANIVRMGQKAVRRVVRVASNNLFVRNALKTAHNIL